MKKQNLYIVGVVCIVVCIGFLGLLFQEESGFTRVYFSAGTDLPDSVLYLKNETIHEIEVNKTYYVNFTITSFEKGPVTYTYIVDSGVLSITNQITLLQGETTTVCLIVIPTEPVKWKLDSTTTMEWENVIDMTKDSWIAERRDFEILIRDDGLPTIVEENYRLPISTDVSQFGRILHSNISIDKLRMKPFVKEYVTEYENDFVKTHIINLIELSINDDKLYLSAKLEELKYTSDKQMFSIRLINSQELQVNPYSYIEEVQEIYFWYRVK